MGNINYKLRALRKKLAGSLGGLDDECEGFVLGNEEVTYQRDKV